MRWVALLALASASAVSMASAVSRAAAQELRSYVIVGDSIPDSLTGRPGDAGRGRAIVADRTLGLCLLCHGGPRPDSPLQGTLAPSLAGAGARWSAGQLRLRLVAPARLVPDTIMPSYYRLDGLRRVAKKYDGKTILSAEQLEDVVAYLATLKD